jgi:hypothetical protein
MPKQKNINKEANKKDGGSESQPKSSAKDVGDVLIIM